uniref:Uncharacterized protein n=1 Tax=Romanomermis culicivorax TaxID=13658 RepID=A0A915L1X2_ROMCU
VFLFFHIYIYNTKYTTENRQGFTGIGGEYDGDRTLNRSTRISYYNDELRTNSTENSGQGNDKKLMTTTKIGRQRLMDEFDKKNIGLKWRRKIINNNENSTMTNYGPCRRSAAGQTTPLV